MKLNRILTTISVIVLLTGCASLFSGIVTLTSVVDSAMKNYAHVYNSGAVSATVDAKVTEAHNKYRQASAVAQQALVAYKSSGDQSEYLKAFAVVKEAAAGLVDMIVPLLTKSQGSTLKSNLAKAQVI